MPWPVSATVIRTNSPAGWSGSSSSRTRSVKMVRVPPSGMASRALMARLRIAFSSWLASQTPWPARGSRRVSIRHRAADRVAKQALHRLDDLVDRDRRHADPLDPRESEQLAGQLGAAAGRFERGLGDPLEPRLLDPRGDQLQPAHDRGEQIVEIVGDAAGELAHRLHLLGLAERLLGLEPLADLGLEPVERGAEVGGALGDPPLEGLVDLAKRGLGPLQLGDVVGDSDEAAMLALRPPARLRDRADPAPFAAAAVAGDQLERLRARPRRPPIRRGPAAASSGWMTVRQSKSTASS